MSCGEPCQKSAHMASEFSGRQLATGRRGDTGRREAVDSRVTSRVVYSHSSTSSSDVVYAVSTGRGVRSRAIRRRRRARSPDPPRRPAPAVRAAHGPPQAPPVPGRAAAGPARGARGAPVLPPFLLLFLITVRLHEKLYRYRSIDYRPAGTVNRGARAEGARRAGRIRTRR